MNKKYPKKYNKKSVALKYEKKNIAPKIVSKGEGKESEKILKMADDYNIPIITDSNLTDNLYQLNINDTIPKELFEIVATIYSFVMRKKENKNEKED
ncbi:MAG: EscU/YscU/HrcU family type III secretion system export apparatus switch protein [Exilispira sp.]|jgi:flagellar biosynthesis protein|nr:EscU/YscU/HrcU family type III secretion system export apparatus switch protein [Exilispira sp.]